jgi:hypothetical protein
MRECSAANGCAKGQEETHIQTRQKSFQKLLEKFEAPPYILGTHATRIAYYCISTYTQRNRHVHLQSRKCANTKHTHNDTLTVQWIELWRLVYTTCARCQSNRRRILSRKTWGIDVRLYYSSPVVVGIISGCRYSALQAVAPEFDWKPWLFNVVPRLCSYGIWNLPIQSFTHT